MVSRARDWFRQAERDLRAAEVTLGAGLYEVACFEAHQAAEKAVKALLNVLHMERRGHSLTMMLRDSGVEAPSDVARCAQYLDKQYIPSRYPNAFDEGAPADYYDRGDAERCVECARRVLEWVRGFVEGRR